MRVGKNKVPGLTKACKWVMACLVLHNFLKLQQEDDMQWLPAPNGRQGNRQRQNQVTTNDADRREGAQRRERLFELSKQMPS